MDTDQEPNGEQDKKPFFSYRNMMFLMTLCFLSALMWLPRFRGPIDVRWDAGVYYILGTSIAEGKGYRLLNEPGDIEVVQYPPVLPLMVALHQRVLGTSDYLVVGPWLRLTYFIIFTAYLCAVYWMALRFLSPKFAALAAAVCALHLHTYFMSNLLFAEIPFALVTMLFIIVNRKSHKPLFLGMSTLLAWCAYLMRTAGIVLLAAWILESLIKRRFKQSLIRMVICLIPVVGWQLYIGEVKSSEAYKDPAYPYQRADYMNYNVGYLENILLIDSFKPELGKASKKDLWKRLVNNASLLPAMMGEQVSADSAFWERPPEGRTRRLPGLPPGLVKALLLVFFFLVLMGALILPFRGEWFIPVYTAATLAVICLTPWPGEFPRYLSPITPLFCLMLFSTFFFVEERFRRLHLPYLKTAAIAIILAFALIIPAIQSYAAVQTLGGDLTKARHYDRDGSEVQSRLFYHNRGWRHFDAAVEWLKAEAPADAVICTTAPHLVHIKTGLKAVQPPYEPDREKAQELIEAVPADYVIVDNLPHPDVSRRYGLPALIEGDPTAESISVRAPWTVVYTCPEMKLKIFKREAGESTEPPE